MDGRIFSIEEFSTFDGPGIRMTIFLKGCPLSCTWCHNPEGQSFEVEYLRSPNGCLGCGACLQAGLEEKLLAFCPAMNTETATASYVGPVAGSTLVRNAISSVLLAAALMLVYIAFRFDFASGLAAVLGLLHDVLIMLSFMVILRNVLQMNSSFIAAMLTIVGYSINNTIIIFDRIRENRKKPACAGLTRAQVVDLSVKESLGRTLTTTLTTLVTIVCLYVLGVSAIREFSLPIIVGVLAGVYSANLINGYLWAALEDLRLGRKKK
jgi:preprotein translocase subunit SecF